jgi:hypothetical protein
MIQKIFPYTVRFKFLCAVLYWYDMVITEGSNEYLSLYWILWRFRLLNFSHYERSWQIQLFTTSSRRKLFKLFKNDLYLTD